MKEFSIVSRYDSLTLAGLVAEPDTNIPIALVQLVHGMCEHKERYIPFMEFLAQQGYVCVIHDHRGHGASVCSKEDLGYLGKDGWLALVEDTKAVSDWALKTYPGLKLHLLGHSMGSLVVRSYAKRYDDLLSTLIISGSPSDNPAKGAGKIIAKLATVFNGSHSRPQLLQQMSFGAFNRPFSREGYRSAWVCSDKEVLEAYHNDPLCQFTFTADGFYNLLTLMQDCFSTRDWQLKNPTLPVHFISGALDPCRGSDKALQSAVDLMKKVGYPNTDLKIFKDMRHEILNETEKKQVWNYVIHSLS